MALSKTQSTRLGVILSVMAGDEVPDAYLERVVLDGFVATDDEYGCYLTEKGIDEKNRLCTLAGLNIKYLSERLKENERVGTGNGNGAECPENPIPAGI